MQSNEDIKDCIGCEVLHQANVKLSNENHDLRGQLQQLIIEIFNLKKRII